jgi:hypothetical protein
MSTIQFNAVVGPDGLIRPPAGTILPVGNVEVVVRAENARMPVADSPALTYDWLLALAQDAEAAAPDLPSDLAENHDHYAHGKPRHGEQT